MIARQVTVVASELLGRAGTGGAGTADSLLAVALGRHGHRVRLLVATGREIGPLNDEWRQIYESSGVEVRLLDRLEGVHPPFLRPAFEVYRALREDAPEVVVVNDWRGLGWTALRARETGIALTKTAFVVHCHGPARVLAEFAQKVPDTLARFGEEITERASVELADAVVSPSAWLVGWMREHRWPVPESALVIPYLRQSTVLGETFTPAPPEPVQRLTFFGQLREGKGIRIYVEALNALEPSLLDGLALEFFGAESKRWTESAIAGALADSVQERISTLRFATGLDRGAALSELRRPGTLAVMPSLLDNAPNTVSECIENAIPFLSTRTGGIPELIAEEDRERVLCEPTAASLAAALDRVLRGAAPLEPAQAATEPAEALERWLKLVDAVAPPAGRQAAQAQRVTVIAGGEESAQGAARLAETSTLAEVEVVEADSRRGGLGRTSTEWVLFLDDEDLPDDELLDRLLEAQAATRADVVTCAVRPAPGAVRFFLGEPGALGLIENQYGVVALYRRALLDSVEVQEGGVDPDWPLLARLSLAGALIVSVPESLARHAGTPGAVGQVPGEALAVLEAFESSEAAVRDLPQLAATLAAASAGSERTPAETTSQRGGYRRALRVVRARLRA